MGGNSPKDGGWLDHAGAGMCRSAELRLEPTPDAPGLARRFVAEMLHRWSLEPLGEEALLALSELVTNAAVHAATPVTVTVSVSGGVFGVTVRDSLAARLPALRVDSGLLSAEVEDRDGRSEASAADSRTHVREAGRAAAGRGLVIVDAVTGRWGVSAGPENKDVWFTMDVPAEWPHRDACVCGPAANGSPLVGAGVVHIPGPWDG